MNVNMDMIRPLLSNASVLILFLLPMVTMRTYSEEKRSGTIELLLTSPLTDFEIILGKFLGAIGLYAGLLAVTVIYIGILFIYGNPEWKPVVDRLPRPAAARQLLHLGRALHLEHDEEPDGRRRGDVRRVPAVLDHQLVRRQRRADGRRRSSTYLSITEHFDDFGKGIIDTKHLVFYLSFITFGLFLTLKSVDSERWRG